jgi:hypothetical protein
MESPDASFDPVQPVWRVRVDSCVSARAIYEACSLGGESPAPGLIRVAGLRGSSYSAGPAAFPGRFRLGRVSRPMARIGLVRSIRGFVVAFMLGPDRRASQSGYGSVCRCICGCAGRAGRLRVSFPGSGPRVCLMGARYVPGSPPWLVGPARALGHGRTGGSQLVALGPQVPKQPRCSPGAAIRSFPSLIKASPLFSTPDTSAFTSSSTVPELSEIKITAAARLLLRTAAAAGSSGSSVRVRGAWGRGGWRFWPQVSAAVSTVASPSIAQKKGNSGG